MFCPGDLPSLCYICKEPNKHRFFLHRDHGLNLFELLFKTYPEWRQKYFFQFGDDPMDELKKQPKVTLLNFKNFFGGKDDILNLP